MPEHHEIADGLLGSSEISAIGYHHFTGTAPGKDEENKISFNEATKTTKRKINWTLATTILVGIVILTMLLATVALLAEMSRRNQETAEEQARSFSALAKVNHNVTQNMDRALIELIPQNVRDESRHRELNERTAAFNSTLDKLIQRIMSNFGWSRAPNNYYYKVFQERVNYKKARYRCSSIGAGLASKGIRNEETRIDIFKRLIKPLNMNTWVGLDDLNDEGIFVWSDGVVSNQNNTNWDKGEPNDAGRRGEDCVHLWPNSWVGYLNDGPCNKNNYFVCETSF